MVPLASCEFLVVGLFYVFSGVSSEIMFFHSIRFTVVARILGLIITIGNTRYYGWGLCGFYKFQLVRKLLAFKTTYLICAMLVVFY